MWGASWVDSIARLLVTYSYLRYLILVEVINPVFGSGEYERNKKIIKENHFFLWL